MGFWSKVVAALSNPKIGQEDANAARCSKCGGPARNESSVYKCSKHGFICYDCSSHKPRQGNTRVCGVCGGIFPEIMTTFDVE